MNKIEEEEKKGERGLRNRGTKKWQEICVDIGIIRAVVTSTTVATVGTLIDEGTRPRDDRRL